MSNLLFANTETVDSEIKGIMGLAETIKKELVGEGRKLFGPGDAVGVSSHGDVLFGYVRLHTPGGVFVVVRDDFGDTEIFENVDNVFRLP